MIEKLEAVKIYTEKKTLLIAVIQQEFWVQLRAIFVELLRQIPCPVMLIKWRSKYTLCKYCILDASNIVVPLSEIRKWQNASTASSKMYLVLSRTLSSRSFRWSSENLCFFYTLMEPLATTLYGLTKALYITTLPYIALKPYRMSIAGPQRRKHQCPLLPSQSSVFTIVKQTVNSW